MQQRDSFASSVPPRSKRMPRAGGETVFFFEAISWIAAGKGGLLVFI